MSVSLDFSPAPPAFLLGDNSPVRSYCLGAWGGLADGVTRVDSTNRPNGIVRLRYVKLAAFHQAIRLLLRRHTVLNARLEARDGVPWICPNACAELNVRMLDIGPRETPQERADAERILGELVWESFDHFAGPLYRAYVVKAGEEYYMGLVVHHFVADAVSIGLLMRELIRLHEAVARRQIARLSPVLVRYQDYLRGMDAWIASEDGRQSRRAVQRGLIGASAPQFDALPPTDIDHQHFIMDDAVVAQVRDTARRMGTSVFTVLLAAQCALASLRTAARSTTLKVITTGREVSSLIPVVGNMADRLYVATDISGDPSFAELVMRTHASVNRCRKLAFVRADFVQADMHELGLSTAAPVFNFRSARRSAPRTEISAADNSPPSLSVPPAKVDQITRPRDAYYLEVVDDGFDLWGSVKYGQGRIENFLMNFEEILRVGCQQPDIHVAQLTRATKGDTVSRETVSLEAVPFG
jgi:hypothetical protein